MIATKSRRVHLVLNGKASGNLLFRSAVHYWRERGHQIQVRVTWEAGDAAEFARQAVAESVDLIVAAGGDGTVNEVVNGMLQADVTPETALAVVPFGTANDFAQTCRLPIGDAAEALRLAIETAPTEIDVAQVNQRYFINVASGGFGAEVTSRTPAEMKRLLGGAAYSLMALVTAAKLTPYRATLELDGRQYRGDLLVLAVGNGRQSGGGFPVTPQALLNDGLLDLLAVHDVEVTEFGRLLSELTDMTAADNQYVTYRQLPGFRLLTEQPLQLNLDGEPLVDTQFEFGILPRRITCVLPGSAPLQKTLPPASTDRPEDYPLVHLTTLDNPAIAELVRIELDEAGIRCHLEGLHQAGLSGVLPIRLFVPRGKLSEAREIVQRHEGNL